MCQQVSHIYLYNIYFFISPYLDAQRRKPTLGCGASTDDDDDVMYGSSVLLGYLVDIMGNHR